MVEELSREEKRALRKAEKRKAKFGEDAPDGGPSAATSSKTVAKTVATPSDTPISIDSTKKEKKSKKRAHDGAEVGDDAPKKHKKRKHVDEATTTEDTTTEPVATPTQAVDTPTKSKREKSKKPKNEGTLAAENSSASTSKKTQNVDAPPKAAASGPIPTFPDPSADESVPESSQKSLAYAYQYSRKDRGVPPADGEEEWKFSKARQNWLVRHIWYDDAVPELYVPLVVHYLQSVKGGGRDAIVKGCKIILNPTPQVVAVPVPNEVAAGDGAAAGTGRKVKFASAEESTEEATATAAPIDPAEERRAEIRQTRARLLLNALET